MGYAIQMKRWLKALLAGTASTMLIGAVATGCGDDDVAGGGTSEKTDGAARDGIANSPADAARSDAVAIGDSGGNDARADAPLDAAMDDAGPQDGDADASADATVDA